jgi:hypothetical protein
MVVIHRIAISLLVSTVFAAISGFGHWNAG